MNVLLFILALVHVIISALMMFQKDYSGLRKLFDKINNSLNNIPLLNLIYIDWLISFVVCLVIILLISMK